jgi:hypothetical protein
LSTWTGKLQSRTVYTRFGRPEEVIVLVDVCGLNPADELDRRGNVIEKEPMPFIFYITVSNGRMDAPLRCLARVDQKVAVCGVLSSTISGLSNEQGEALYSEDPELPVPWETLTPEERGAVYQDRLRPLSRAIRPVIRVADAANIRPIGRGRMAK